MAFFSNTDTGVTTNRFSQDFMYIDSELPLALLDFIECKPSILIPSLSFL